ncbi:hypothetical protein QR680_000759 [Steinernema hermaphroditum]|uniref:Fcf2 pre-rRNA processing C-terminal domain-containing protein n=1 Tax=Steinernema hermaphroditum TaxID=289476 RepID=A0AA39LER6_9BILA|nr:hypothetical protein QR680_000759 [Steinernema hermaphroditum]
MFHTHYGFKATAETLTVVLKVDLYGIPRSIMSIAQCCESPVHSDSEEEFASTYKETAFRCYNGTHKPAIVDLGDYLSYDTGTTEEDAVENEEEPEKTVDAMDTTDKVDPDVARALKKSVLHNGFEKGLGEGYDVKSRNRLKRERREERAKTTGTNWFDMQATEMTDEKKNDIEILQMRAQLDPLSRYRKAYRDVMPKFFQVGRVVEHKADFYSGRLSKKERKRTIAEELLADQEFQTKSRKRYDKVKAHEAVIKRQISKKLQARSKPRSSRKKKDL